MLQLLTLLTVIQYLNHIDIPPFLIENPEKALFF